ncbi:DUF2922 domain-containing protein [Acetobacterium sp.]|uniref:DUF2922 domain-containing protein n=1 Tax=Acetobacterium sp. TaxID=1872094 RepID=UPI003593AD95
MAEFKLAMVFKNAVDKNVSMTIPDVKPTVTQAEAVALMDTILTTGILPLIISHWCLRSIVKWWKPPLLTSTTSRKGTVVVYHKR